MAGNPFDPPTSTVAVAPGAAATLEAVGERARAPNPFDPPMLALAGPPPTAEPALAAAAAPPASPAGNPFDPPSAAQSAPPPGALEPIEPDSGQSNFGAVLEATDKPGNASRMVLNNTLKALQGDEEWDPLGAAATGWKHDKVLTGSDILEQQDILADSPILRGIAGFGIDLVTDPLSYVGVGGLTKAGKLVKAGEGVARAGRSIALGSDLAKGLRAIELGAAPAGVAKDPALWKAIVKEGTSLAGIRGVEATQLGASLGEQALRGQRALVSFAGVPLYRGSGTLARVGAFGNALLKVEPIGKVAQDLNKLFNTRIGMRADLSAAIDTMKAGDRTAAYLTSQAITTAATEHGELGQTAQRLAITPFELGQQINLAQQTRVEGGHLAQLVADGKITQEAADFALKRKALSADQLAKEQSVGLGTAHLRDLSDQAMAEYRSALLDARAAQTGPAAERKALEAVAEEKRQAWRRVATVRVEGGQELEAVDADYLARILTKEGYQVLGKFPGATFGEKADVMVKTLLARSEQGTMEGRRFLRDLSFEETQKAAANLYKGVRIFEDRPEFIQLARTLSHVRATTAAETLRDIATRFGMQADKHALTDPNLAFLIRSGNLDKLGDGERLLSQYAKGNGMKYYAEGPMAGHFLPNDIAEWSDRWFQAQGRESMTQFGQTWDTMNRWFKAWSLSIRPSYHARNMVSNLWANHVAGMSGADAMRDYLTSAMIQMGGKEGVLTERGLLGSKAIMVQHPDLGKLQEALKLTDDQFAQHMAKTGGMVPLTHDLVRDLAERHGVLHTGFYGATIEDKVMRLAGQAPPETTAAKIRNFLPYLSTDQNRILRMGMLGGQAVEDNARLAHFIWQLRGGATPEDAASSVFKHLYNHAELSGFEKSVGRFSMFFGWTRHNLPAQVEQLITHPEKIGQVQKLKQEVEGYAAKDGGGTLPMAWMPEWLRHQVPIQIGRSPSNPKAFNAITLANYLPIGDLEQAFDPREMMQHLFNSISPFMKEPIEQALNLDTFRSKIEDKSVAQIDPGGAGVKVDFLGARVNPRIAHLLRSLVAVNEIDRWNPFDVFGKPYVAGQPKGESWLAAVKEHLGPAGALLPDAADVRQRQDVQPEWMRWLQEFTGVTPRATDPGKEYNRRYFDEKARRSEIQKVLAQANRKGDQRQAAEAQRALAESYAREAGLNRSFNANHLQR